MCMFNNIDSLPKMGGNNAKKATLLPFLIAFEILILLSLINEQNSANDLRMDILLLRRQNTSKA